jgi:tetratricopeptide (TPR) repeat protein
MEGAVESFLDVFRFNQHLVADQLRAAELSENVEGRIRGYLDVASVASEDSKDFSVFLIERCVQIARDFRMSSLLALSLVSLGKAEFRRGRLKEAQRSFEQAVSEISSGPISELLKEASEAFVDTTWRIAEENSATAVSEYRRAREIAVRANLPTIGNCDLRLGIALHEVREYSEASEVLRRCMALASEISDRSLELHARAALAENLESAQDFVGAKEQLEILMKVATDSGDLQSHSVGCLRLGLLLLGRVQQDQKSFGLDNAASNKENVERAVELLEMHYDLSRQLGAQDTALARLVLGIARATYRLPQYFNVILHDLNALKAWKCRRTPLSRPH